MRAPRRRLHESAEARTALALAAALGVAFGLIAYWANAGGTPSVDRSVLNWVVDHRTSWLTSVVQAVTWLGSGAVLYPAVAVATLAWWRDGRDWRPGLVLAAALGGGTALYNIFKPIFERPRPPAADAVQTYSHWSFPSGHATQAMAFYGMLAFLIAFRHGRRATPWVVSAVVILVVGATRIYLGAHWFSDVLGGYALGGCWCALVAGLALAAGWVRRRASAGAPAGE
ncbi:MAG: phosphatase PAP2 family protein [Gaiellales bacterium]